MDVGKMEKVIKSLKLKVNDLNIVLEYLNNNEVFVYVTEDNKKEEYAGKIKKLN